MKRIVQLALSLVLLSAAITLCAADLCEIIGTDPNAFFDIEVETMMKSKPFQENGFNRVFQWADKDKTAIHYIFLKCGVELTVFNSKPLEVKISFEDGKISEITCLFYSRGDRGTITKEEFDSTLKILTNELNALMNVKPITKKEKMMKDNSVSQSIWVSEKASCFLRWSFRGGHSNFKPEFINVRFEQFNPENDPRKAGYAMRQKKEMSKGKTNLKNNVATKEDGAVYISNVPMVDQGMKGYCSVAVMERVAKYYGNDSVSQHDFASMTKSSAMRGTSISNIREMLKKAGPKVGVKIRDEWSLIENLKDFNALLKQYNKKASKMKKPKVEPFQRGNTVFVGETFAMMNPTIVAEIRKDDKRGCKTFKKIIKENIDAGIPVVWAVNLSWMPIESRKNGMQMGGGHMRLIIGYNDKTSEIVYTDSWGAGYEYETMSETDAWIITTEYMIVEPR